MSAGSGRDEREDYRIGDEFGFAHAQYGDHSGYISQWSRTRFVGTLPACFRGSAYDGGPMTVAKRQLRFGAFFSVPSCHPTGWRHPEAIAETDLSMKHLVDMARTAERGLLDCLF